MSANVTTVAPVAVDLREAHDLADPILDAALELVSRWGVNKTTLGDVAKAAGCSRATLYRAFPGGQQQLFHALGGRELGTYLQDIEQAIAAADDLQDALTSAFTTAAVGLGQHDAAQFVLANEPELLLPFLGFKQVDVLYAHTAQRIGPHLERFLARERATWCAEWCARVFLTYLFNPNPSIDLTDEADAGSLVATFILPAFP